VTGLVQKTEAQAFLLYGAALSTGSLLMKISIYFWAVVPTNSMPKKKKKGKSTEWGEKAPDRFFCFFLTFLLS
jgi:hypothetical protein